MSYGASTSDLDNYFGYTGSDSLTSNPITLDGTTSGSVKYVKLEKGNTVKLCISEIAVYGTAMTTTTTTTTTTTPPQLVVLAFGK